MLVRKILNAVSSSSSSATSSDLYFDKVVLLLNCDGTNGSTSFTDLSSVPKSITVNNATVSTATKKFGTGSMVCTSGASAPAGSYLKADYSPDFNFGSGDFTVECWAYFNAIAAFQGVCSININASSTYGCLRLETQNGSPNFYVLMRSSGTANWISTNAFGTYSAGSWIHLAVVRYGTQITLYCNGVGYPCFTLTGDIDNQQGPAYFGWSNNGSFNGFVDDCRITKGLARYTANFTPPTTAFPTASSVVPPTVDPFWNNVLLALTGDGSNGSTSITDISTYARTVTLSGNAQVNTSNKIAGTGSIYFDGVGDYITIPTNSSLYFGTSDFTIEMWYKPVSRVAGSPNYPSLLSNSSVSGWAAGCFDLFDRAAGGGNGFNFYSYNINSASGTVVASTSAILNNVWYHVAVTRSGSTFRMFVNGVQESTATSAASIDSASQPWTIGVRQPSNGDYINGYIDNLRITKGVARYTANFTPPTYQLPITVDPSADPYLINVGLLLNGNGTNGSTTFTDLSISPKSISIGGTVVVDTTTKKYGTGSIYFNGSSYLTHTAITLDADLTIECWINRSTISGNRVLYSGSTGWIGWSTNTNFVWSCGITINFTIPDTTNTWAHYAVVRQNGIIRVYVNGQVAPENGSTTTAFGCSEIIGQNGGYLFACYLDDLRVTNGIARYTANFTPPTAELHIP